MPGTPSRPLPADQGYGYGWFTGGTGATKLVNHSGSVDGFWAYNGFYPARDVVAVILSNLDTTAINPISARLNLLATATARESSMRPLPARGSTLERPVAVTQRSSAH